MSLRDRGAIIQWFGKPRWLWRQVVEAGIRYYVRRPWVSPQIWLRDLTKYAERRGQFRAYGRH